MTTRILMSAAGLLLTASAAVAVPPPARAAETTVPACNSRESLERVLSDPRGALPDDCRRVQIRTLDSTNGRLCYIDPGSGGDQGLVGSITSAVAPDKWWVRCDSLRQVLDQTLG